MGFWNTFLIVDNGSATEIISIEGEARQPRPRVFLGFKTADNSISTTCLLLNNVINLTIFDNFDFCQISSNYSSKAKVLNFLKMKFWGIFYDVNLDEKICENCVVWINYLVRCSGAFQIWRNSEWSRSRRRFCDWWLSQFWFGYFRFGYFWLSGRQIGDDCWSDLWFCNRLACRFRTTWPLWEIVLVAKIKCSATFTPMTLSIRFTYLRIESFFENLPALLWQVSKANEIKSKSRRKFKAQSNL